MGTHCHTAHRLTGRGCVQTLVLYPHMRGDKAQTLLTALLTRAHACTHMLTPHALLHTHAPTPSPCRHTDTHTLHTCTFTIHTLLSPSTSLSHTHTHLSPGSLTVHCPGESEQINREKPPLPATRHAQVQFGWGGLQAGSSGGSLGSGWRGHDSQPRVGG